MVSVTVPLGSVNESQSMVSEKGELIERIDLL
jgi:hypothetical protein